MSKIPNHLSNACINLDSRYDACDAITAANILRGPVEEVKARLRTYQDGDMLAKEFDHYLASQNCPTCYWAMLYKRLPGKMRNMDNQLQGIQYLEVLCNRDEIEEYRSLQQFIKTKTDPLTHYAYYLEDQEDEHNNCMVRMIFKTQSGNTLKKPQLEKAFPEGAIIRNNIKVSSQIINEITGSSNHVKQGF